VLVPAGVLGLAAGAMCAVLWLAGGPAHAEGRPWDAGAWMVGGTALLALAATWFALPPPRSMLSRPGGHLLALMIGVPLAVGLWLALGHSSYADPYERTGWRCIGMTAATAPWPFAALVYLRRHFDPVLPALTGGALGAAAAAWAAVMVELWCPLGRADHVAFGHALPLVVLVAAGALVGGRLFRMKGQRWAA
jgi:hypothetical protein